MTVYKKTVAIYQINEAVSFWNKGSEFLLMLQGNELMTFDWEVSTLSTELCTQFPEFINH